jgi:CRP/FNR family transcriptional regulator, cyclic AMP receptor protein
MTRHELLEGLAEGDAAGVVALAAFARVPAGNTLFRLGDEAESLYLIESGLMALTMPIQVRGRDENVRIDERLPGQTLGWSSLIPPHRFTFTASALVDTELLVFPRIRLLEYVAAKPEVGCLLFRNVAAVVGHRLQLVQAVWVRQMQHMVNLAHA